jgi:prostaglandin-endoperoxide synthase 2
LSNSLFDEVLKLAGGAIDACGWADSALSKVMVNKLVECTRNRPHPWSTTSDYTSWKSLTDRTYQARHLPAAEAPGRQPDPDKIDVLFARPNGTQTFSNKSTCLFPAFAQYLTDGFIRTDPNNRAKTTSNHEIDLCPLYGRTEAQTLILRENDNSQGSRGRLKSQFIGSEEFPCFLYLPNGTVKPEFVGLDQPLVGIPIPVSQLTTLFAVGGDRANSTPFSSMMNTLLLREHNRVAGELERQNQSWDDERVFQTARNIMIPMFIKIVVEQYINHISPTPVNFVADPSVAWTANWNRPNWVTAEFSLLYRWHSLMPDVIDWQGTDIAIANLGLNNKPLLDVGLEAAFTIAAVQPAAKLGALNTNAALLPLERLAVLQARSNHLRGYNAYRVQFGLPRAETFTDISSDPRIVTILQDLYENKVDDVEFYPGLFSEDRVPKCPLPGLLLRMVGVDAFSQALTNPLLSEHVYNEKTFTAWGFQLIKDTRCLGDLLARQGAKIHPKAVTMTLPSWSYCWDAP